MAVQGSGLHHSINKFGTLQEALHSERSSTMSIIMLDPGRMISNGQAAECRGLEQRNAAFASCDAYLDRREADAPVRRRLIARVKAQIERGEYDSPEKIDAAVERLLVRFRRG
jgi:hypothetical protein